MDSFLGTKELNIRILHLDESEEFYDLLRKELARLHCDFEIDWANSNDIAFTLIDSNYYDCILLDFLSDRVNGLKMMKTLRSNGNATPVIFVADEKNEKNDSYRNSKIRCFCYYFNDITCVLCSRRGAFREQSDCRLRNKLARFRFGVLWRQSYPY